MNLLDASHMHWRSLVCARVHSIDKVRDNLSRLNWKYLPPLPSKLLSVDHLLQTQYHKFHSINLFQLLHHLCRCKQRSICCVSLQDGHQFRADRQIAIQRHATSNRCIWANIHHESFLCTIHAYFLIQQLLSHNLPILLCALLDALRSIVMRFQKRCILKQAENIHSWLSPCIHALSLILLQKPHHSPKLGLTRTNSRWIKRACFSLIIIY